MGDVAINIAVLDGDEPGHYVVVADRVDPPARRVLGDVRRDAG